MEIRDLRFFCLTAEMEHVTKAAEKLGVAQPFLTKIISQLEKEIGVPLFDNVGRQIKLNDYGKAFYSHAKKILVELDNLRDDMDEMIERQSRTIRVLTNTESLYPELVVEYQKAHPGYILSMEYASRDTMLNSLRTGETDFAVCSPPLPDDKERGICTEVVFAEHACVMLPPGHRCIGKEDLTFDDMVGEDLITTTKDSAMRSNLDPYMEKIGYHPNIVCETNDYNLIIKSVLSGMGFAIIPRSLFFSIPSIREYCVESSYSDTLGEIGISHGTIQNEANAQSDFIPFVNDYVDRNVKKYFTHFSNVTDNFDEVNE